VHSSGTFQLTDEGRDEPIEVMTEKGYHLVTIENKKYKISKNTNLGKYLFNFRHIVKSNKYNICMEPIHIL
jgi:hypothetical protein